MVFGLSRLLRGRRRDGLGLGLAMQGLGQALPRPAILRLSLTLTLYSILSSLPLPLNTQVQSYLYTAFLTSLNASMFGSILASLFRFPALETLFDSVFGGEGTRALLGLYGGLIMMLGGLWGIVESAIVVYWAMQIARILEDRMYTSNNRANGSGAWKGLIIGLSMIMIIFWILGMGKTIVLTKSWVVAGVVGMLGAIVGLKALATDGGTLFEFAGISLYLSFLGLSGLFEEVAVPSRILEYVTSEDGKEIIQAVDLKHKEMRLIVLGFGGLLTVLGLASIPRVLEAIFDGTEENNWTDHGTRYRPVHKQNPSSDQQQDRYNDNQQGATNEPNQVATWWRGPLNAFSVMVLTFRFLVWKKHLEQTEYYALGCRALHAIAAVIFYFIFRRMEDVEEEKTHRE